METCAYGCGNIGKFVLKSGKVCCEKSQNSCPVLKKKNANAIKRLHSAGTNFHKFTVEQQIVGRKSYIESNKDIVFIENSLYRGKGLMNYLIKLNLREYKCECCGIVEWNNKKLSLQVHHVNGVSNDNRLENLQILCPNCHTQTDNYCGKNKNTGKILVSDEVLIEAIKTTESIRHALIKVGLTCVVGNYTRAYKLKETLNKNF